MTPAKSRRGRPAGRGPWMSRRASGRNAGVKKGSPMMWSQWRWVSSAVARYGVWKRFASSSAADAGGDGVAVGADAGAEVEDDRLVAGRLERDAGRVAAVALVAGAVARRRAADTPEGGRRYPRHHAQDDTLTGRRPKQRPAGSGGSSSVRRVRGPRRAPPRRGTAPRAAGRSTLLGARRTSRTHQASASERLRATPASTSVSRVRRSAIRSRVMTGPRRS